MHNISDFIENHLKKLLSESEQGLIEIQRGDLAEKFKCVPSQINYVLTTRFTLEKGFVIESRRGGRGYIRILKVPLNNQTNLIHDLYGLIGKEITPSHAEGIIQRLMEEDLITTRESNLMRAIVKSKVLYPGLAEQDQLRACLLKIMIRAILHT
jgi:transcriptional regulator CtsR